MDHIFLIQIVQKFYGLVKPYVALFHVLNVRRFGDIRTFYIVIYTLQKFELIIKSSSKYHFDQNEALFCNE